MARAAVAACVSLFAAMTPSLESVHELLRVACLAVGMQTDDEADPTERAKLQHYMLNDMAHTGHCRRYQLHQNSLVSLQEVFRRLNSTTLHMFLSCATETQQLALGLGQAQPP